MNGAETFLLDHGLTIVFLVAVVNQLGVPIPASPWLLAAGALAHTGALPVAATVAMAVAGSLIAHYAWYEAGKRSGTKILHLVCRVSLEPDACVRRTENLFAKRGPSALIVAHFVPGLVTVAQPLAGTIGMPLAIFLLYNAIGSLIWAGGYIGAGYLFEKELAKVAHAAAGFGWGLAIAGGAIMVGYIGWKLLRRRRILKSLAQARITPEELKRRLDAGDRIVVVDLRHELELAQDPSMIPNAIRIPAEELAARHGEIPRNVEVVLYCS